MDYQARPEDLYRRAAVVRAIEESHGQLYAARHPQRPPAMPLTRGQRRKAVSNNFPGASLFWLAVFAGVIGWPWMLYGHGHHDVAMLATGLLWDAIAGVPVVLGFVVTWISRDVRRNRGR